MNVLTVCTKHNICIQNAALFGNVSCIRLVLHCLEMSHVFGLCFTCTQTPWARYVRRLIVLLRMSCATPRHAAPHTLEEELMKFKMASCMRQAACLPEPRPAPPRRVLESCLRLRSHSLNFLMWTAFSPLINNESQAPCHVAQPPCTCATRRD